MPVKKLGYEDNMIRVRIDDDFQDDINKYLEEHPKDFESNSHFIRNCITEFINTKDEKSENTVELQEKINQNEANIQKLVENNQRILDVLTQKLNSESTESDDALEDYKTELILQKLRKKWMDEVELSNELMMEEIDVLKRINGFLKIGKIIQKGNKYKVNPNAK